MWKWYVEQIIKTHVNCVRDLLAAYETLPPGPDKDTVKGAMASMSMMLERLNHDYPVLLKTARATGEDHDASFSPN